ncbi:MAG: GerMN domain-containing protein [Spirochaetota bacterium]
MRPFLIAVRNFLATCFRLTKIAITGLVAATRAFVVWISPPPRFVSALLGLVFVVSLVSWAVWDRQSLYVLYFPTIANRNALSAEVRDLPQRASPEGRAELLASEFLLGPRDPSLSPALPSGSTLARVILRKGVLFVDLGEEAALTTRPELELAIKALRMTLTLSVHEAGRIVVTIGGQEPWLESISLLGTGQKSSEKN